MHDSVPQGLVLALYKGTKPGIPGLQNRLGRLLDRGPYSHTELIFSNRLSASSSFMDGGVRTKDIGYSSVGCWDFLPLPIRLEERAKTWFLEHDGLKYDILGNIRFATGFAKDHPTKWFCSEADMASLGFSEAFRYGPSGAATVLMDVFNTSMIYVNA